MNDTKKLILAIKKINSNAEFEASDIDNIIWKNNTTPISKSDIEAQFSNVEQEETNNTNARTSAINKLKGATYSALTDAEAKALFGE